MTIASVPETVLWLTLAFVLGVVVGSLWGHWAGIYRRQTVLSLATLLLLVTDGLTSYRAAMRELGLTKRHRPDGMRANNRAENSHTPIRQRERKRQKFRWQGSAQRFLSTRAAVYNNFNVKQHLIFQPTLRHFRAVAHQTWAAATAAA
jgi:hypothetical protein